MAESFDIYEKGYSGTEQKTQKSYFWLLSVVPMVVFEKNEGTPLVVKITSSFVLHK
jgi:hypothetical protein